jgi:hypothetical protein
LRAGRTFRIWCIFLCFGVLLVGCLMPFEGRSCHLRAGRAFRVWVHIFVFWGLVGSTWLFEGRGCDFDRLCKCDKEKYWEVV